jgi:hypothetical protein
VEKAAEEQRKKELEDQEEMEYQAALTASMTSPAYTADPPPLPLPVPFDPPVRHDSPLQQSMPPFDNSDDRSPPQQPTTFPVLHCPAWPKWVLAESPTILQQLCTPPLDFYDPKDRLWIHADLSYPHEVSKDGYLFYRWRGIHCKNFEEYIDRLSKKPPHQRTNMRGERECVREGKKVKLKQRAPPSAKGDDSEVEFVDSTTIIKQEMVVTPNSKRRRPPSFPVLSPKRLRLQSCGASSLLTSPILVEDSPLPLPSASASTFTPPRGLPSIASKKCWYSQLHVVDMVAGFRQYRQLKPTNPRWESRFEAAFNLPPPPRCSFYDQLQRWKMATPEQREATLAANHTPAGLWSNLVRLVPLK